MGGISFHIVYFSKQHQHLFVIRRQLEHYFRIFCRILYLLHFQ